MNHASPSSRRGPPQTGSIFVSLNLLAGEYLQRFRESGALANLAQAERAATESLRILSGDNYAGLIYLASVRLVQHDFAAAEVLARQALSLRPARQAAHAVLADAQVGLGRYDEAADTLYALLERGADLPVLSRLANLAFLQGDEINAIDFWKQAIEASAAAPAEQQAWARIQLGATYFALGDLRKAEAQHRAALRLFPGHVGALAGLAQIKAAQERWSEAAELYTKAVSRQPRPEYAAALGDVYTLAGDERAAADQYALVEAIAALYDAAGVNTDLQIARYFATRGRDPRRALGVARSAYEAAPNVYAADALALALYHNGEFRDAAAYSLEATRQGTLEAGFYYNAGLISNALGDYGAAHRYLKAALDLNPRFAPLQAGHARELFAAIESNR